MARATARVEFLNRAAIAAGIELTSISAVRENKPLGFAEFVNRVYPRYQWYHHNKVLARSLQRVVDGELKRLMVFMPPRHGKSLMASKLFPAYYLYRHPDRWVGVNSYAAELSYTFSRAARDAYKTVEGKLKDDAATIKNWETPDGGGLWAAGVGGPITGKGGHLLIIDDPLKNAEEAASVLIKAKQQDWYGSTFYTRAEPDAAIVVIQTRWSDDDLSGWLLSQESEDEPERWHIINFAAIKEDHALKVPASCTVEEDWRSPGEALCPERYDATKLKKIERRLGSYFWAALYQQNPAPMTGGLFKQSWWKFYKQLPAKFDRLVQSWDCTFKDAATSDYVVGQLWGQVGGEFYLIEQIRDRLDINATINAIRMLSSKYPESRAKLIEDKANGSAVIALLKREIPGLIPVNPEGGKVVRAQAIAPYVESGNVHLPDASLAPWVGDFVLEFSRFPNGANDDQVDACSQALIWMNTRSGVGFSQGRSRY